jgi:hypothetical protein
MSGIGSSARLRRIMKPLVFAMTSVALVVTSAQAASAASEQSSPPPAHTIEGAQLLTLGDELSGGGGPVDFWLISLTGGDEIQLATQTPTVTPGESSAIYEFQLYPPGTTDATFTNTEPAASVATPAGSSKDIIYFQAPYTGTFILAVCENAGNCSSTESGSGVDPMQPYTFTPTLADSFCGTSPAGEVQASSTIAATAAFSLPHCQAGGGGPVDFWQVKLTGGDQVQLVTQTPTVTPGDADTSYQFELYPPGTTDANFPDTPPVTSTATPEGSSKAVIYLQAPYTATFILAVCENVGDDCRSTDSGGGVDPMQPYTFTPTLAHSWCGTRPAGEVRAGSTIARATAFSLPHCQAGGGGPVDFWRISLSAGDQVQIATETPTVTPGDADTFYQFDLFPPGTTDTSFPDTPPVSSAATSEGSSTAILDLEAPKSGTFILAVCENVGDDCRSTDSGSGIDPMQPYAFTPTLVGGRETTTTLKLSAASAIYGKEKALKLSVAVKARFAGSPTGTVTVKAGKKKICTIRLEARKGTCSPASNTLLAPGTYSITASYGGSKTSAPSTSSAITLKITKPKKGKSARRPEFDSIALGRPRPELISIAA